jgi:hypothetical protein
MFLGQLIIYGHSFGKLVLKVSNDVLKLKDSVFQELLLRLHVFGFFFLIENDLLDFFIEDSLQMFYPLFLCLL